MEKRITKSNAIINSSYRLSLNELRIVLFGLSHINPRDEEFLLFHRINVRELAEFYNVGEKDRGSFYDDIKNALINKFWEREFSYYDDELEEIVKRRWLIEVRYGRKDGTLAYEYNPKIKNQLQQLAKRFTSYFLTNIANMKSAYAVRIYEIAIMYLNASQKNKATFKKKVDDLKHHLGIDDKYKHFFNMKAKVIEIAKRDINKHSDIRLSYKVIKLGRSPVEIEFTVNKKIDKGTPSLPHTTKDSEITLVPKLSSSIIEKAKEIVKKAGNRWNIYAIEQQFYDYMRKKGMPDNPEGAFIGFVKKKVEAMP